MGRSGFLVGLRGVIVVESRTFHQEDETVPSVASNGPTRGHGFPRAVNSGEIT